MILHCLHTGSSGNCYLLKDDDNDTLILDAGVSIENIKRSLEYSFGSVSGVLITHSHKDHSMSADALEMYGLDVWRPYLVEGGKDKRTFGKWAIQSFPLPHDECPCCGFYIRHIDGFKMLYLTDCEYSPFRFTSQKVNSILCEANWDPKYVDLNAGNRRHKLLGHMSLDVCLDFLKANKTDALQSVVICHMSYYTLDVNEAVETIKREIGIENVQAAEKGKEIEL